MTESTSTTTAAEPALADLVAGLLDGASAPSGFLGNLLGVQCQVAQASEGAVLAVESAQRVRVLALHPPPASGAAAPAWVPQAARLASGLERTSGSHLEPLATNGRNGTGDDHAMLLLVPLHGTDLAGPVGAFVVRNGSAAAIDRTRERLEMTSGLVGLQRVCAAAYDRAAQTERLRGAMELLDAVNDHTRLRAAAIAFCNEIAARWGADRVTLGFLEGRYVRTIAVSHTERFDRKMRLVQDLESAMEECFDQDTEVVHPAPPDSAVIARAASELSHRHGPASILSLPLRQNGEPTAVVTVEWPVDRPIRLEAAETLRLACNLCTARLFDLHANDKWIGAKVLDSARGVLAKVASPDHTWPKVIAASIFLGLLFVIFARGADRVDASFEVQTIEHRVVPAPFDGRLQRVEVEPGQTVTAGDTVLATLDTAELRLQLAAASAERARYVKEEDLALRDRKTAEVQIAQANIRRIDAERHLLEHQIAQARIVAPISGTVVTGDLRRQLGAPLEKGTILFEIAPLDAFRAELAIPEDRIADLTGEGAADAPMRGTMASVAHPGDYIEFEVERINPIAEVVDQQNVFRVRVKLLEDRGWLRPGMKGVAKVNVGRRSYAGMWTRTFVNWVRMKLWI